MKVFLFRDYLDSINSSSSKNLKEIAEIESIDSIPSSLMRLNGFLCRPCMISDGSLYIEFVGDLRKEVSVSSSDNMICPHCGFEDKDSWEQSDHCDENECDACGTIFSHERNVLVTYSTHVVSINKEILNLN
jgi:Zn ribbon nucleic-acid-binding protein